MGDVGSLAIGGAIGTVSSPDETGIHAGDGGRRVCHRSAVGDAAGGCFQDDQADDRHRQATFQDDATAPSLRNAGLEGVEDRLSIFDSGDPVCVVESLDVEAEVSSCRLPIADCQFAIFNDHWDHRSSQYADSQSHNRQLAIGNRQSC